MRRLLITGALRRRLDELRAVRIAGVKPERFGPVQEFVAQTRARIMQANGDALAAEALLLLRPHEPNRRWMESDTGCLASLRALCLGQQTNARPGVGPPDAPFIELFNERGRQPLERFRMLAERYAYPLNISLVSEEAIRELLLMRLMVYDRTRLLKHGARALESDQMLLGLNLLSLHAAQTEDLRYLDALNYYYELLPSEWEPAGEHNWLLVSYLALYAMALAARSKEECECV